MAKSRVSGSLPRRIKRMVTLGEACGYYDKTMANSWRKSFVQAEKAYVEYKQKRHTSSESSE